MLKLEKALKEWVSLDLLSQTQANQIQQHEAAKSGSWILSGLLTLGVIAISIGVISLIAANWQEISDVVKLAIDFSLLIGLSIGILCAWNVKRELLFEILLFAFLFFCLASIGLIAQIYQTGGELYQALMLWTIITIGTLFVSKRLPTPLVWTAGFLIAVGCTVANSPLFWPVFQDKDHAVLVLIPLFSWCLMLLFQKKAATQSNVVRALGIWTIVSGLIGIISIELRSKYLFPIIVSDFVPYLPSYVLAVFAVIGTWLTTPYHYIQKLLLSLVVLIFVILFTLPLTEAGNAISALFILSLMAIFFASLQRRGLFQLFLILIGIRLLVLYFQALGGLALTGVGLVIAGGLMIAMAILWNKYRTVLAISIERWIQ